jgi:hypothetical protein
MLLIVFVSLTAVAAVIIAAAPARLDPAPDQILRLDDCIQHRFLDAKAFGMRRILPMPYHGVQVFQPENKTEQAIVDQLHRKDMSGALFGRPACLGYDVSANTGSAAFSAA